MLYRRGAYEEAADTLTIGVQLSQEEKERVACWIDLNIPFCGDYREAHAWTEDEIAFYDRYQKKRDGMADIEHANIQLLLSELHK